MSGIRDSIEQAYQRAVKGVRTTMGASQIPVGLTPRETIWALNKTRLYRYRSPQPVERRYPVPLLLVYALINKPYIFDLRPGRSFVEFMLGQGFDVYLLDWGVPSPEDRGTRFDAGDDRRERAPTCASPGWDDQRPRHRVRLAPPRGARRAVGCHYRRAALGRP